MGTERVDELLRKIHSRMGEISKEDNARDLQYVAERWANTDLVSLFVFSDAFEGMSTSKRQMHVLKWLDNLSPEERSSIVTFLLLTQKELRDRNNTASPPASGTILGFGTLDDNNGY